MKKTILCYNVTADLTFLRMEGFKVVEMGYEVLSDSQGYQNTKRRLCLTKGKKACWIWNNHEKNPIEAKTLYKLWIVEQKISFKNFLNLPEETIGERMARERQEILESARYTQNGTAIYVVPLQKTFLEESSVIIQEEEGVNWKGDRYYRVVIPESINEAEMLFELAKSENVDGIGKCGGAFWLQTTESHLDTLIKKLTS